MLPDRKVPYKEHLFFFTGIIAQNKIFENSKIRQKGIKFIDGLAPAAP